MRSETTILFLLTASMVLAAPIPWQSHTTAIADQLFGSLKLSPEGTAAAAADLGAHFNDHRPFTPTADMPPSVVLALRRPIATTWLMSLSTVKPGTVHAPTAAAGKGINALIRIASTDDNAETVFLSSGIEAAGHTVKEPVTTYEVVDSEPDAHEKLPGYPEPSRVLRPEEQVNRKPSRSDIPCFYAQLRRDYNDMVVISLVAIFLLVVVACELWYSAEHEATDVEDVPASTIKLENTPQPTAK